MTRLPALNAKRMEKALFALGFVAVRQRGSHVFYRHPDGRTTTLPHHAGRDLARPLLREVLREIEVSPEELAEVLKSI
jgi:predicted RNA binding protein YcfA (HicA-like mRNA interferase family)